MKVWNSDVSDKFYKYALQLKLNMYQINTRFTIISATILIQFINFSY